MGIVEQAVSTVQFGTLVLPKLRLRLASDDQVHTGVFSFLP